MNYRFKPGDNVWIMSYVGYESGIEAVVFSVYTSDKENHCAREHNRYVVYEPSCLKGILYSLHDVSENELVERRN